MKNYKRFMSLIMALIMVFSSSTAVLAAETNENINIQIDEASAKRNYLETMSTNDDLLNNLTGIYTGSSAKTLNIPITIPSGGGYLYLVILTKGPVRATMYSNGVKVSSTVYVQRSDNVQWCPINFDRTTDNFWADGNYTVKVEILFNYEYSFCIASGKYKR